MELCKFSWTLSMEVVIFSVMDHPPCGDPSPAEEEEAGSDTCPVLGRVLGFCSVLGTSKSWTTSVFTELNTPWPTWKQSPGMPSAAEGAQGTAKPSVLPWCYLPQLHFCHPWGTHVAPLTLPKVPPSSHFCVSLLRFALD